MASDDEEALMETQDPQKRREIRKQYRQIQESINEKRYDLQNPGNEGLRETLAQCNTIYKEVRMTREAALDSSIMAQLSHLGMKQAQALHTDFRMFDPTECCQKLAAFLVRQGAAGGAADLRSSHITPLGWVTLGQAIQPFFRRSPSFRFMYGAFNKGLPKPKERRKRKPEEDKSQQNAAHRKPEDVSAKGLLNREQTTEEVARIHKILKENCPKGEGLCFFEFVVNPESFGQTIENIFYTSFLARDGLVRFVLDNDKLPAIQPIEDKEGGGSKDSSGMVRNQVVMSLTMQEWRDIIETFNIREPLIPTRPSKH